MSSITALILAGGRATRMDGRDKGLLTLDGETFAVRLTRLMSPQVERILISANRNLEHYETIGVPVISDTVPDFQGPLAGMLSGLVSMSSDWMITLPCDGPFVASDYVNRMFQAAERSGNPLAVATDGQRMQPVYALIHRSLEHSLREFLGSGDRKIDRWFGQHPFDQVEFADHPDMFINVNTPEELAAVQSKASV